MEENKNLIVVKEVQVVRLDNSDLYDVWILDEDGEHTKQVCGHPKKGTPRVLLKDGLKKDLICMKSPGAGTVHKGVGFCELHEKGKLSESSKNFLEIARVYSEHNSLSEILKDVEAIEINATDVNDEIKMLTALQLQMLEWVDLNPDDLGGEWNPGRIKWMVDIVKEIIKSKEAAARIQGSMRLEMNTLKQVVEMIMSFLAKELHNLNIPREVVVELFHKMNTDVFVPATNQAMVSDKMNVLKIRSEDK